MIIGIYCITNIINGKSYIGKSVNIERRWVKHKSYLQTGIHPNSHLQSAWNKYGEDAFTFSIIEECTESILSDKEISYISMFDSKLNGYNLTDGGEGVSGMVVSEETRQRMSDANKGKRLSEETKEKISKSLKGKIVSEETRGKLAEASRGKVFSEETRQKLSIIGKKKKNWITRKVKESL